MVERVASQGRVVGFDIHFDLFFQPELFQETVYSGHVVIVLMLGWLLRFRLNQQCALETNFVFMFHHHLHEAANLLAFLT